MRLGPSAVHRMSFPVMHELRGEYSALFYVLERQLEAARSRAALMSSRSRCAPRPKSSLNRSARSCVCWSRAAGRCIG